MRYCRIAQIETTSSNRFLKHSTDACSPKFLGDGTADEERGWVGDPIFDDGKETNPTVIEQRLVMSQAVPLEEMSRLGMRQEK